MKPTKIIFALAIGAGIVAAGCVKPKNNITNIDPNVKTHNQDINNTKSEADNLNNEINSTLSNLSGFGKNGELQAYSVCGAAIDSSQQNAATPTVIFTFDGTTNCYGKIRSGEVKVELIQGSKWSDAGAVLKVTHTNYKVVYTTLNNHYLTFNGVKYLTDVDGYDPLDLFFAGSLTVKVSERANNLKVTFENGDTATWSVARIATGTYTYNSVSGIGASFISNGDTTIGGKTIDSWGVTRFGTDFTTEMVQPWKSNTTCGVWKPTSGKYTSTTDNFTVTATLGVDGNGNPVSSGCPNNLKLEWTLGQYSGSGVYGYYW